MINAAIGVLSVFMWALRVGVYAWRPETEVD